MSPGKQPETFLASNDKMASTMSGNQQNGRGNRGNVCEDPSVSHIMSDKELQSLNIKHLNRKLKEMGLPKNIIDKVKQRRRTLKNRKYATDCREKKDGEVHKLEGSKTSETNELQMLSDGNDRLRAEIDAMKDKYQRMVRFAEKNKIKLRERNIPI